MASGNTQRDGSGDTWWQVVDNLGRQRIYDDWSPGLTYDTNADDSDKTFTVPTSTEWKIKSIWVSYVSTSTAGNRQLTIEIQDASSNIIARLKAGTTQAASQTRYYLFAPDVPDLTAFRDTNHLTTTMPTWVLPASYVVRVYDSGTVAPAADDMSVYILLESRPV